MVHKNFPKRRSAPSSAGPWTCAGRVLRFAGKILFIVTSHFERMSRSRGKLTAGPALCVPAAPFRLRGIRGIQVLCAIAALVLLPAIAWAIPPGTVITNTAQADYTINSVNQTIFSNSVSVTTIAFGTPSTMEIFRYAPSSPTITATVQLTDYWDTTSGTFLTQGPPVDPVSGPIAVGGPVPLSTESTFMVGEPIFVILTDPDQNGDSAMADTVTVSVRRDLTGEEEILILRETDLDTGVFTGYVQSGPLPENLMDGTLDVEPGAQVTGRYTDPVDSTDRSSDTAVFDPSGILYVTKTAGRTSAGIGEFISFNVTAENTSVSTVPTVVVNDTLPVGFSYKAGSTRIDKLAAPDPVISSDGRILTFALGDVPAGVTVDIFYVTEVGVGTRPGTVVNVASAVSGLIISNTALARIEITEDLYTSTNFLVGQVATGSCDEGGSEEGGWGLEGVRIFMEDGTYTVTDEYGRYHFEGVQQGSHVVQMDLESIPEWYEVIDCERDTRSAGRPHSRFVDLKGGTLWRVDFNVKLKAREQGKALLELKSAAGEEGSDESGQGLEGVRIFLEEGTFKVADEFSRYHIEGEQPGPHVFQMNLESIPEWYEVIDALLERRSATGKDGVKYYATLSGETVPLKNLRFTVELPEGVEYLPGTSRLEGQPIEDPVMNSTTLVWDLGNAPANWKKGVTFETRVKEGWTWSESGTLTHEEVSRELTRDDYTEKTIEGRMSVVLSRAHLAFDTPERNDLSTPAIENLYLRVSEEEVTRTKKFIYRPHFDTFAARLTDGDKVALDVVASEFNPPSISLVTVSGHTDDVPISPRSRHVFADNYALSLARAGSVASYLRIVLDLPSEKFAFQGRGPDEPLASNDTEAGRATNRRVEVNVVTTDVNRRAALEPLKDLSSTQVEIPGLRPGQTWGDSGESVTDQQQGQGEPNLLKNTDWLDAADTSLSIVWPPENYEPRVPSLKIGVKHDARSRIQLLLNGEKVSPLSFMGAEKNSQKTSALSQWMGLVLQEGDNLLQANEINSLGLIIGSSEKIIHLSGQPVYAEFLPGESKLVADARTPPVIAVRLTDRDGHNAREMMIGQYSVDPPYLPLSPLGEGRQENLSGKGTYQSYFGVEERGIVRLKLKPTMKSGKATVKLKLAGGWREINVRMQPDLREWILVGLAEGTVGYNTVTGNMQSLEDSGGEEDLYSDGRIAFYVKGQIKGEWLMTMSYDTDKGSAVNRGQFSQTIDPDAYYTLYGDASEQDHDATSTSKLYVKMERDDFYVLFGDYDTGLTVTELGRYSRSFTGLKAEKIGDLSFNVFASRTKQAFVKDEIPGDGTSGLYYLSFNDIVINSEKVNIETRDRFNSQNIISSKGLSRHTDYNIDYVDGNIYFKRPIPQRDQFFNPMYIVVDYETYDPDADGLTYGGRGAVKLKDTGAEVGVTHVHEDRGTSEGDLSVVDVKFKMAKGLQLKAEAAVSSNDDGTTATDGSSYLAELTRTSDRFQGILYLREQDDFGLGHQNSSESGMRRSGAELNYRLTGNTTASATASRQINLVTDAERDLEEIGLQYSGDSTTLTGGLRRVVDTDSGGIEEESKQLTTGARWTTTDGKIRLSANHDQSFGNNDNTDYPTRTSVGADYQINRAAWLYVEHEITSGAELETYATRAGVKATPWKGGSASSDVTSETTENGERLYASLGLTQDWQVTEDWKLSAGYEQSRTLKEPVSQPLNDEVPPASGGEDYTAVSVGTDNRFGIWEFNARLEVRTADNSNKQGMISNLFGEPSVGIGLSAALTYFDTDSNSGTSTMDGDLRFGLVYRPLGSGWTLLDRLEFIVEEETGGTVDMDNWRIVNNFNANYRPGPDYQVAFQLGTKYIRDTIDSVVYSGSVNLVGIETRYDLNENWDIGARASVLQSVEANQLKYGLGASLGWGLMDNLWLSFGYNFLGFEDKDFSQGDFTAQGPFVKFRFKFDQADLKSLLD